ncbi:hypothetical protein ABBQ38_005078 [Trebouxia sp. C0009 RCD-2024]
MYIVVASVTALAVAYGMTWFRSGVKLSGKHVIVTGGSEGLGYCLACAFYEKGCRVTILARTQSKLDQALSNLRELNLAAGGQAQALPADVTNFEQINAAVQKAEATFGPCDIIICNAGATEPGRVEDLPASVFHRLMTINYLGVVHSVKAVLPGMLQNRSGHISFVSSSMGLIGFAGYSAYAPTKWAVRGLADTLRNELQGSGVSVSVGFPADMRGASYAQEELIKPEECKAISKAVGSVYEPEQVAKKIVYGIERGRYLLPSPDVLQDWFLMDATASWSVRSLPVLVSSVLAPLIPLVMLVFTKFIDRIVRQHRQKRETGTANS